MGKRWAAYGLLAIVMLWCGVVLADTGGSMGGGSWGGGGHSSGGGGYSSSRSSSSGSSWSHSSGWGGSSSSSSSWRSKPSRSYDYGSRDYSSHDYSYSGGGSSYSGVEPGVVILFLGIGLAAIFILWRFAMMDNSGGYSPSSDAYIEPSTVMFNSADVSVLRVAIDGRARKFVQSELKRIAQSADTGTDAGRATMLREVALMLRRVRDAWIYGGAVNEAVQWINAAKPLFDKHVSDARSRFREEVIRNADGKITTSAASEYSPRSHEGEGVILVTLVIAARRELFTVTRIGNGDDLRQALEAASQLTPDNLVAIEVIWQPAEDGDRLSTMELEAKYPRPDLIPIQGALVGKTFCDYCSGPFPAELVSCPHCGAPAPGRSKAA